MLCVWSVQIVAYFSSKRLYSFENPKLGVSVLSTCIHDPNTRHFVLHWYLQKQCDDGFEDNVLVKDKLSCSISLLLVSL